MEFRRTLSALSFRWFLNICERIIFFFSHLYLQHSTLLIQLTTFQIQVWLYLQKVDLKERYSFWFTYTADLTFKWILSAHKEQRNKVLLLSEPLMLTRKPQKLIQQLRSVDHLLQNDLQANFTGSADFAIWHLSSVTDIRTLQLISCRAATGCQGIKWFISAQTECKLIQFKQKIAKKLVWSSRVWFLNLKSKCDRVK